MGKQIDHNSFWVIKQNPITKIGVFPYLGRQISPELEPNKIYQVLRPESELFTEEALASFNALPITIGHALLGPREEGFTPAEEKGIDGTTGASAERKDDKVVNDIKLFSERIKDEVNHGKKELSAGYFCDFVPESGTWNGRHYDFVQKNIRGNHIALVDKGRSGHDVRVMDSAEGLGSRQFVCDAMEMGKFEPAQDENDKHDSKTGQFAKKGSGSSESKEEKQNSIVSIDGKELGDYSSIEELREKAVNFYKEHLQGKTAKNPVLGDILFSRKGRDKYEAFSADPNKLKMIVGIKKLIETSTDVKSEDLHKPRKDGAVRFHRISGEIKVGENPATKVKILVWEDRNGNKFYDLELPKKEPHQG